MPNIKRTIVCEICGEVVDVYHNHQKICFSKECKRKQINLAAKRYRKNHLDICKQRCSEYKNKNKDSIKEYNKNKRYNYDLKIGKELIITCLHCGKEFLYTNKKGTKPLYCSKKCQYNHNKKIVYPNSENILKKCNICGKEFIAESKWNAYNYCSEECKNKYKYSYHEVRMLNNARKRSKEEGLPFDLCLNDIVIPDKCPILGIPFLFDSKRSDNSPSLDKFIPSLGYVKNNIEVISYRANRIKNDSTLDELIKITNWVKEKHGRK